TGCGGTLTDSWTYTDACGRTISGSRTITVTPAALPVMTAPGPITIACGATPPSSTLTFTNELSGSCLITGTSATSTFSAAPGPCGGTITETWTATDACGRVLVPVTRTITVSPAPAPVFTGAPADVTVACGAVPAVPTVDYSNSASGTCLISGTVTATRSGTVTGCGGTLTDSWTYTDACGRTISGSRTITVTPAALPVMTAPGPITIACGATPASSTLTFTNGLAGSCLITGTSATSTFSAAPGPCGGTITETWTATDACGRVLVPVTRTITVSPAPAPVFTGAPADVTVACGAVPAVPTVDYTNGASGSCLISGTVTATRSGTVTGCGGTLTDSWTDTDACGRTISGSRAITVTPGALPVMTAPGAITIACGATPAASTLTFTNG